MPPRGGNPRQPSGSGLSFPYGDCLNKRKAKQPKCIESPRTTEARSGKRKPVSRKIILKQKDRARCRSTKTRRAPKLDFYFELAGMMTRRNPGVKGG
jgi:hypothetical protein